MLSSKFDIHCVITSCLFFITNLLSIILYLTYTNRGHFDFQKFLKFDPELIQEEWKFRNSRSTFELLSGLLESLTWFSLSIPLLKLAWIQSLCGRHQIGIHISIAMLAIAGSFTEFLARIFTLGTNGVSEWISSSFNLGNWTSDTGNDNIGWRTLELVTMVTDSMLLWIDAVEWLFLFGVFVLLFLSVLRSSTSVVRSLSMKWACFGLIIGVLCLFDFCSNMLRYRSWIYYSTISMVFTAVNRLFLIPFWLIWLSRQLPLAEERLCAINASSNVSGNGLNNLPQSYGSVEMATKQPQIILSNTESSLS